MVSKRILKRIQAKGKGCVFASSDFLDIGSRDAVDQTLSRLARKGTIRRVARGLYDYPRVNPRLGTLSPRVDTVAKAMAKSADARHLQISGAQAANALGLSTQVPAHRTYLTDGPSRRVYVDRRCVSLRHTSPKNLIGAGKMTGMVYQALRYLGPDGIDDSAIQRLRATLSSADKRNLKGAAKRMPGWMARVIINRLAV